MSLGILLGYLFMSSDLFYLIHSRSFVLCVYCVNVLWMIISAVDVHVIEFLYQSAQQLPEE